MSTTQHRPRPTSDKNGWRGIDSTLVALSANLVAESAVVFGLSIWATTSYVSKIPGAEWTGRAKYIVVEGIIMFAASTVLMLASIALGKRSEYRFKNRPVASNSKFIAESRWPRFLQSSGGMILYMLFFGCWHMVGMGLSWKQYSEECSAGAPGRMPPFEHDSPQAPCRAAVVASVWHTIGAAMWIVFAGVAYIVHKVTHNLDRKYDQQLELTNLALDV
ncbi:hypothetical protein GQ42DRAFT_164043 [Ramicandelaber brevisporus]|nr:hypothetical protein GQ42DRAFT_164043 [Ramicandelaber brevisporus]